MFSLDLVFNPPTHRACCVASVGLRGSLASRAMLPGCTFRKTSCDGVAAAWNAVWRIRTPALRHLHNLDTCTLNSISHPCRRSYEAKTITASPPVLPIANTRKRQGAEIRCAPHLPPCKPASRRPARQIHAPGVRWQAEEGAPYALLPLTRKFIQPLSHPPRASGICGPGAREPLADSALDLT